MIAASFDAVTDAIGIVLLVVIVVAAALFDRASIGRRSPGLPLVVVIVVLSSVLVAIVTARFLVLA